MSRIVRKSLHFACLHAFPSADSALSKSVLWLSSCNKAFCSQFEDCRSVACTHITHDESTSVKNHFLWDDLWGQRAYFPERDHIIAHKAWKAAFQATPHKSSRDGSIITHKSSFPISQLNKVVTAGNPSSQKFQKIWATCRWLSTFTGSSVRIDWPCALTIDPAPWAMKEILKRSRRLSEHCEAQLHLIRQVQRE